MPRDKRSASVAAKPLRQPLRVGMRRVVNLVASLFKSKSRLEAENAALRHQLIVLQRKVRALVPFTNSDRLFFVQLYRWFSSVLKGVTIIRPETLVRWHRAG